MGDTKRDGIWLVAEFDGNRAVLAKIIGKGNKLTPEVRHQILSEKRTEAAHCYDFFAPLRPIQQQRPDGTVASGITRDPIVTGNHFTFTPMPVSLNLNLAPKVFFFDEMVVADRNRYEGFMNMADDTNERQRMSEVGLVSGRQSAGPPVKIKMPPGMTGGIDLSQLKP